MKPKPTPSFRGPVLFSLLLTAAMLGLSLWAWLAIGPDSRIPVHWDVHGNPDGFGGRNMLFLMPGIALGLTGLFWILPRIEPRKGNLLRSSKAYRAVWIATLLFEAALHGIMTRAALGQEISMERFMAIALGLLFAVIGNVLGKVRSNHVFGVRTPWTLSSELSWNKTHRLTGWLFVTYGLGMLGLGIAGAGGTAIFWMTIVFIPVIVLVAFGCSYLVWRDDPAVRQSQA